MLKVDINLVFTIINLLVLFVAMRIFFFKPIKKIIEDRQAEADRQFEEAKEKQEQAEDLKNRYEASLAEAEMEKKKILAKTRKDADAEYQKILKDAQDAADDVVSSAVSKAESQKEQILKSAKSEIASMVVDAASKVVCGAGNADADSALYDKFLNEAGEKE